MREIINFSSYWRSTTFSATVEPTIYLLAFGFGFGSLVSTVGGLRLRRVRRHRHGGHRGAVLLRLRRACSARSSSTSSSAPTTRSSPRRSTPRSWSPPRRCGSRRAPACTAASPMLVAMRLRARPELGHAARAALRLHRGLRLGVLRDPRVGARDVDRELQLRHQRGADAAVPRRGHVLPARPSCPSGRRRWRSSTRSTTSSSSCATPRSASRAGRPRPLRGARRLRPAMWRLAIWRLEKRLID